MRIKIRGTYLDVFKGGVNDLIVVRETVELEGFQVQPHMVAYLHTVCVRM